MSPDEVSSATQQHQAQSKGWVWRDFIPCPHCDKTGTCHRGGGDKSCGRCIAGRWLWKKLPKDDDYVGLVCSVCSGKGLVEPYALKIERLFPFFLAAGLAALGFSLLFIRPGGLTPEQSLPFVGTLLGSITGYYFGGERARALEARRSHHIPETPGHSEN
jgi:hypothetical protein